MEQVIKSLEKVFTDGKAEVYVVDDFATAEECQHIINLIDQTAYRSQVVGDNEDKSVVSETRTSSSSTLSMMDPIVNDINERMHRQLPEWVDLKLSEIPQGQRYEPGQFFKDHNDYFDVNNKSAYDHHVGNMGQRNWTFMLYLNDVEEGGETEFARLNLKFKPKRGRGIIWKNLYENGQGNPDTLHAGRPPEKGTKYIITKWFRNGIGIDSQPLERPNSNLDTDGKPLASIKAVEPQKVKDVDYKNKTFTCHEDFPRFTETGFKVVDIPEKAWGLIQDGYSMLKDKIRDENYEGMGNQIYIKEKGFNTPAAQIIPIWELPTTVKLIHEFLQPIHEEWSGVELEPTFIYGIRSYLDGATLFTHKDKIETHHISSIILVDEDAREPWALDIQAHDGTWHKVYIKPGQMILYESTTCDHGRLDAFQGNYFRNFFVHYKVKGWTYKTEG